MVQSEMPECLAKLLQWNARGRAGFLIPGARILSEYHKQGLEPGGSVGGETRCQKVWRDHFGKQGEDADRSGRDVRQGGALKTMVNPHVGTHV